MRKTKVVAYRLNGKLFKIYNSAKEASLAFKGHPRTIDKCIRGERLTAFNYQWRRFENNEITSSIAPIKKTSLSRINKPIAEINIDGSIVKKYPSIRKASLDLNINPHSLRDNLNHKTKSTHQRYFRYLSQDEVENDGIIIYHLKGKKKKSRNLIR